MGISPVSKKRRHGKKKPQNPGLKTNSQEAVNYICLECNETEKIPLNVVRDFDAWDDGDPLVPPQFSCQKCGGEMYPEYYKGIHGYEYKISDVR